MAIRSIIFSLSVAFLFLIGIVKADDSTLFSFIPQIDGTSLKHSSDYTESGSKWGPGLDEKQVFHHQSSWGDNNGWQIRIGKGGQIYSFRGPFGEAMPPQIHKGSKWNDEVWQLVSVSSAKNNATRVKLHGQNVQPLAYFIHGSGTYLRDPQLKQTFYNPVLAEHATPSSYAILNWGQHAHVPTTYKSNALYYTQLNVTENGTIELNYAIHNFGKDVLNYFNTPWGGVRHTSLPVHILSNPDGSYAPTAFVPFSNKGIKNAGETGGWSGFFQKDSPDAWGIVLVFANGVDNHGEAKVRYRWGYAGSKKNARDYFVSVVNPRLPVGEGQTLKVRLYAFVDQLKNARNRAEALRKKVSYKVTKFQEPPTRTVTVKAENFSGELKLSAWPKAGGKPLFLIEQTKTGKRYVTTDLYRFASKSDFKEFYPGYKGNDSLLRPYDANTRYLKLLGFVGKDLKLE